MNYFLQKISVLIFILISSVFVFAQKGNYERESSMPFQPMFSFGTAYYSFQGDIMGPNTNALLGNMGYRAGMRLNISKIVDASLLFSNASFFEENDDASFKSNVDAIGLHLGYTLNSIFKQSRISPYLNAGIQSLSFQTLKANFKSDRESAIAIPLGLGFRLNISERIDLDATVNYTIAMGDIDKSVEGNSDKFMSANFTIHYDLFTPKPTVETYFDDSYYADVNFKAMDIEDEDGDLIADVDDYCPKTPLGVKVNQFGCPLDRDNDGIADYIDQENNTRKGAVVDEKGVQLTDEKYYSMYSDYQAASREYANFYNENEIKRENYKTVDEYLIAKANAFNKAYNQGVDSDNTVKELRYKVKVGAFSSGVPANMYNKYLSLADLESISQDNGVVIYAVGTYNTLDDALARGYELEAKGFNETSTLVDNNGEVSDYVALLPEPVIDEEEKVESPEEAALEVKNDNNIVKVITESKNETTYRIQIGAFNKELSGPVFAGVDNVVSFTGRDELVRYMAGSFTEYKDAVDYQMQMRARGFEDAFIVTYKNGERISLNVAIKIERTYPKAKVVVEDLIPKLIIEFKVQIDVAKESLSAEDLAKMGKLGNIEKIAKGTDMTEYYAGTYLSLEKANFRLAEAKSVGYSQAFIVCAKDGERITLKEAKELLK